jgi:hypothetical protein
MSSGRILWASSASACEETLRPGLRKLGYVDGPKVSRGRQLLAEQR